MTTEITLHLMIHTETHIETHIYQMKRLIASLSVKDNLIINNGPLYCYKFIIKFSFHISVMPIEIFLIWHQYPWPFGNIGCGFITLASELVTNVSIITMIAFTIER